MSFSRFARGAMLLLPLGLLCVPRSAPAMTLEEATPFFSWQHYEWREYSNGRRILREDGPLKTGGIVLGAITDHSLTLKGKVEIFGGEVDYNGQTQAPNPMPLVTNVGYFGTNEELDLGYRHSPKYLGLEPFGGIGYRWWLRDLQRSTTSTGVATSGYTESWQTWYGRLGARGRYVTDTGVSFFLEGGARYPFYTGNSVDFVGAGTTTFNPGGRWSGFAETGLSFRHLKVTAGYQGFRFSSSPIKSVAGQRYFQPTSESDTFGVSLGYNFR